MATNTTNRYCEALGIQAPSLEGAKDSPDANSYSLLIVALLERGAPMTLEEAARRFEEAGIASGWADPWSRVQLAYVERDRTGWPFWLVAEQGYVIDERDVQLARLAAADRGAI